MSRINQLAEALEGAFAAKGPVLVFGAWQPMGSLSAAVALLLLTASHRLRGIPLNLVLTCAPFARLDDVALQRTVRVARVIGSRRRARVVRLEGKRQLPGDFVPSDWEVAAQVLARDVPSTRLELKSFVAVDRYAADSRLHAGSRPVLGNRIKDGPRLPQLRVLTARSASDAAVAAVTLGDLLLIGLNGARGAKTLGLASSTLQRLSLDKPALILAEGPSELIRHSTTPVLSHLKQCVCLAPAPPRPRLQVTLLGQARVQYEQQFRYAMPSDDLSPDELELADLGAAVWRQRWRTVDIQAGDASIRDRFLQSVAELRRRRPASADRFNMLVQLLQTSARDGAAAAGDRMRAVVEAVRRVAISDTSRVLVVVGGAGEESVVNQAVRGIARGNVSVALSRHLARMRMTADSVIVCGFYGPATLDGLLRVRPANVRWMTDPIEAGQAAGELHRQAALLHHLGLVDMADVVGGFDAGLREAAFGTRAADPEHHPHLFAWTSPSVSSSGHEDPGEDHGSRVEEIDVDADRLLVLADGTHLHVNANRRFDVLRSQSPHPDLVRAGDLQEGDHILVVGGSYQRTLSELLLEEMDRTVLQREAAARRTWVTVMQLSVKARGMTVEEVARQMRVQGVAIQKQRVQAWLRGHDQETTPRDWRSFLVFARAVGIALAEEELREYFNSIRRWRVGHQRRGRDVVRTVRAAYFGGLAAADVARIETEWGLGVRDLIEGCRVEEVEATESLS